VSSNRLFVRGVVSFFAFAVIGPASAVYGQLYPVNAGQSVTQRPMPVAVRNNLYCAGYVQSAPLTTTMQLVGGHEEQEHYIYAENDVVYIGGGSGARLKAGDILSVLRPRGKVSDAITDKQGSLGYLVQEVGAIEVIRVKESHAIARVKASCDNFLLGDLVEPMQERVSPVFKERLPLDRYGDASGKPMGRLFLTRENQELITRDQIVYIDLGAEDNVKVGDYVTVFRPLGEGNLHMPADRETGQATSYGFPSDHYKGSKFSSSGPRRKGDMAQNGTASQNDAKSERPAWIRKVVGELVVLNVKERTATAVVVRTGQEIHPGDFVEIQ